MRIIVAFILGLVSFFYLGELITRFFKKPLSSIFGLVIVLLGIFLTILGERFIYPPLNTLLSALTIGSGLGLMFYHLLSQSYFFSERVEREFVRRHQSLVERCLEILPGALTWLALTSPLWLSFTLPFALAYLIIIADVYWCVTAFRIGILILIGQRRIKKVTAIDWLKRLKEDFPESWQDYYQLILVPTYKEALYILEPNFEAILNSNYPQKKIILMVGFEGRDDPGKIEDVTKHLEKYKKKLALVTTSIHPFGLSGEVPGQGTNKNWMINQIVPVLKERGVDFKKVIVTTLDADFVIHRQFLSGMLHKYLSTPADQRDISSFTGVFFYYNNYWQTPAPMRLIAAGTAFWQLSEMVGSDKYINFSSMSINLATLLDIGLWIPDKVNDDSGFFFKAYYHYKGRYKVIPHFLPISADANLDVTFLKTFQNTYLQLKRWAYGVEHMPFVISQYFKGSDIDFWTRTDMLFFITWSYFKWGTLALFITLGGNIIPLVNPNYTKSVLAINLSTISSYLLNGAFIGLFSTIYVHEKTVPARPKNWNIIQSIWSYLQWVLIPIILVTIATFPAIDAQTSLMFGRYMTFRVTNKARSTI